MHVSSVAVLPYEMFSHIVCETVISTVTRSLWPTILVSPATNPPDVTVIFLFLSGAISLQLPIRALFSFSLHLFQDPCLRNANGHFHRAIEKNPSAGKELKPGRKFVIFKFPATKLLFHDNVKRFSFFFVKVKVCF